MNYLIRIPFIMIFYWLGLLSQWIGSALEDGTINLDNFRNSIALYGYKGYQLFMGWSEDFDKYEFWWKSYSCPVCGANSKDGNIDIIFEDKIFNYINTTFTVKDVSSKKCKNCGEIFIEDFDMDRIEPLIREWHEKVDKGEYNVK